MLNLFVCLEDRRSVSFGRVHRAGMKAVFAAAIFVAACGFAALTGSAQTAHYLSTQTSLFSSALSNAQGIAVDSSGNIYIADSGANLILKETLANGIYTESHIGTQLNDPIAIAIDGNGNLFVADKGNSRIAEETFGGGNSYSESTVGSFGAPQGVALDRSGNLYVGDTGNSRVVKGTISAGTFTQTAVVATGSVYTQVAVDGTGNVYVSDPHNHQVLKFSAGSYVQSTVATGIQQPAGLVVDGTGNVFIADQGTAGLGRILKEAPGAPYTQTVLFAGGAGTEPERRLLFHECRLDRCLQAGDERNDLRSNGGGIGKLERYPVFRLRFRGLAGRRHCGHAGYYRV